MNNIRIKFKRYVILNVQKKYDSNKNQINYFYKEVGSWDTDSHLNLSLNEIVFPNSNIILNSVCSEQCSFGSVKVPLFFICHLSTKRMK